MKKIIMCLVLTFTILIAGSQFASYYCPSPSQLKEANVKFEKKTNECDIVIQNSGITYTVNHGWPQYKNFSSSVSCKVAIKAAGEFNFSAEQSSVSCLYGGMPGSISATFPSDYQPDYDSGNWGNISPIAPLVAECVPNPPPMGGLFDCPVKEN